MHASGCQRLFAIFSGNYTMSRLLQNPADTVAHVGVVIDHQYRARFSPGCGVVRYGTKNPAESPVIVGNRAVRKSGNERQDLVMGARTALHRTDDARCDQMPNFRPDFRSRLAQSRRMPSRKKARATVVVKIDELLPP